MDAPPVLEAAEHVFDLLALVVDQSNQIAAVCVSIAGRHEQALALIETAILMGFPEARPPCAIIRASAAEADGRSLEAGEAIGAMLAMETDDGDALAAARYATRSAATGTGQREAVEKLYVVLERACGNGSIWSYAALPVSHALFAMLGALDDAFAVAGKILDRWRDDGLLATFALNGLWLPSMEAFRADPRFQDYVRSLNMFEYWQRHGAPDGHRLEGDTLVVLA